MVSAITTRIEFKFVIFPNTILLQDTFDFLCLNKRKVLVSTTKVTSKVLDKKIRLQ